MPNRPEEPFTDGTAWLTWMAWLFGFGGIHRLYLGKTWTGLLYLFTWGLFGVGQVLDATRLNAMVDGENLKALGARVRANGLPPGPQVKALPAAATPDDRGRLRLKLVEAAAQRGGELSVTQGVMATGADFKQVEAMLDEMARSGYVDIANDSESGVVVYRFGELA